MAMRQFTRREAGHRPVPSLISALLAVSNSATSSFGSAPSSTHLIYVAESGDWAGVVTGVVGTSF
jgi:hypothetical protein